MSEDKVALVDALSKLGLGTLMAAILGSVIWFNHTEQNTLNRVIEDSMAIQTDLLSKMEENQKTYLDIIEKHQKSADVIAEFLMEQGVINKALEEGK